MRPVSALSWLRHRQRAALILDAMTPLGVADIAEVINVSEHEAERICDAAVEAVARALGRPTDVRKDLLEAAKELKPPDQQPDAEKKEEEPPRRVVRLLLETPPARAPKPPQFEPTLSPVDALLVEAEAEPADITLEAPTPPKPPVPIPIAVPRRERQVARDGLIAFAALAVVVLALLPMSSKAGRTPSRPSRPVVQAVTQARPPAARPNAVVATPVVTVHRGDTLWALAKRTLRDPMRWREIWRLNRGRLMKTGQRFTDPNLIRPGWVLKVPG
jgi:nucleoid-associated protein YgaU